MNTQELQETSCSSVEVREMPGLERRAQEQGPRGAPAPHGARAGAPGRARGADQGGVPVPRAPAEPKRTGRGALQEVAARDLEGRAQSLDDQLCPTVDKRAQPTGSHSLYI